MIRVSQAQTVHFILQKNGLVEPITDLSNLVKGLGGLPGDSWLIPNLAAYLRLPHFSLADLATALTQNRTLIQGMLMRGQRYIVSADDYTLFYAATARQRKQSLNSEFRLWGIDNAEIEQVSQAILEAMGDQPLSAAEISERLPASLARDLTQTSRGGRVSQTTSIALALHWLSANGVLYADHTMDKPEREAYESPIYAPLSYWYPELDLTNLPGEAEAQATLVRTYLTAFGPATEADVSFWTGFGKSETARAIGALSGETTLALVEGIPGITILLKSQAAGLSATSPPTEPLLNILPANDPFITAHRASRTRYFTDQTLQRRVFDSSGAAKPTIVLNGQILGLWQWSQDARVQKIIWQLFAALPQNLEAKIRAKIEQVEIFLAKL
jgi:hypothetical protein